MMEIILDAMGGDNAPQAIIEGALKGLEAYEDIKITLTGDREKIGALLKDKNFDASRLDIVHTTQVIEMEDSPVKALKEKEDSSMVVALKRLAENPEKSMMVSAGSTGALVAGATLIVKRMAGIKRPALAPVLPARDGQALLIDCGANVDCKPVYLYQFGIMGSIYMQCVFGIEKPRVALINNGTEEEKGNELTKQAYALLKDAPINFVGNVEGRDLLSGAYDVLVCDGFVGNVVLKNVEGSAKLILGMLKDYIKQSTRAKIGALFMKGAFSKLKKKMDYKEYGGSLLLGLNGGVMKMHGSSDAHAVFNSIRGARGFISGDVVGKMKSTLGQISKKDEGDK